MKNKFRALLVYRDKTLNDNLKQVLGKRNFEVLEVAQDGDWETLGDNQNIDICFIQDKELGEKILRKLNHENPQTIVINLTSPLKLSKKIPNIVFTLPHCQASEDLDFLIQTLTEIIKRDNARSELAAMLIHDIRSPLNSMLGYLELLINERFGELNEGQKNFLEKAMVLGDRVLDMIEDVNEIYQSEQYIFQIDKKTFNIDEVVDEVIRDLWVLADKKDIKLKKDIPSRFPLLYGDPFQIQRVLINLITNGIKYCKPGSTIQISSRKASNRTAEILVEDNGGGIPHEQLKAVFDKFYRIQRDENFWRGYGLGLYICKIIVKSHGGKIQAQNNEMGGVSFIFSLPFAQSRSNQ